jgi:hypothetical protein
MKVSRIFIITIIAVGSCLLLAACNNTPQSKMALNAQREAENQRVTEQQESQAEALDAQERDYCIKMGAPPKSPNYYDCRMKVEQTLREQARVTPTQADVIAAITRGGLSHTYVSPQAVANERVYGNQNQLRCLSIPDSTGTIITSCH